MGNWLDHIVEILQVVSLVAATLGLLLAVVQLYIGRKEAQAGRDLEVILSLSESFRTRWEAGWGDALDRIEAGASGGASPDEQGEIELSYMLNWIDWLGNLLDCGHLAKGDAIMSAIGSPMRRMLEAGRPMIERDVALHGRNYWRGALHVAEQLDVRFSFAKA